MAKRKTQVQKFIEAAKSSGAIEDPVEFNRMLGGIAKAPAPETVQDRKKPKPETKKPNK